MSSLDLSLAKVLVGLALAVSSFGGAVVPRLLRQIRPADAATWLPLGNCLSGGLLLGTGLMHFFAEATATLADTNGFKDCGEAAQAALQTSVTWMLAGIGLSLAIDKVLLRSSALAAAVAGQHGHSHDCNDLLHSSASETSNENEHPTSGHDTSGIATLIVAVLLGFHAVLEGLSLAFEPNLAALRAGFIPLFVHKFFDGLLLGIQAARAAPSTPDRSHGRRVAKTEDPLDADPTTGPSQPPAQSSSMSRGFLCFAFLWSCVTPAALVAAIAAGQTPQSSSSTAEHAAASGGGMGPRFQSLGAGTFVYVAMMEVLTSEFRNTPPAPRRLHSKAGSTPWSPVVKLCVVFVGCVLVQLIEGGHHHH